MHAAKVALGMAFFLPFSYLEAILLPVMKGGLPFTAVPALLALCLVIGVAWGIKIRDRRLYAFAIPFVLCELFVAVAGAMSGVAYLIVFN